MKTCTSCLQSKEESEFYPDKQKKDGLRSSCKTCVSSYWKRSRHVRTDEQVSTSKVRSRKHQLKRYGLSLDQYNEMIESQNGVCAICHKVMDSPHVDHNHETGHTRGLLCSFCNTGLGYFFENIESLGRAKEYLDYYAEGK